MTDQTARLCRMIGVFVRAHDFVGIVVLRLMYNELHLEEFVHILMTKQIAMLLKRTVWIRKTQFSLRIRAV